MCILVSVRLWQRVGSVLFYSVVTFSLLDQKILHIYIYIRYIVEDLTDHYLG